MRGHAYAKTAAKAAFAAGLLTLALPAEADEVAFCVSCQGPDQTYVCRVTGEDLRKSDALKLYCVVRTAKDGGHSSCGARSDISDCNGVEKIYAYNGPALPEGLADDPRVKGIAEKIAHEQKEFDRSEEEKRKSLAAVTGRAFSASRRGIRNMRASIGGEAEPNRSALPAPSPPMDPLPDHQVSAAPSLPLSAASGPASQSAAFPLADGSGDLAPPRKSRIGRSAQNVGSFARSSYRCVRSLFRRCRSDPDALPSPN